MTFRVGINGFGRMGRLALRAAIMRGMPFDIVHINETQGDVTTAGHLLEFDSVHGRWSASIKAGEDDLTVDGHSIGFSQIADPVAVDWVGRDIDLVMECTGKFTKTKTLKPFLDTGVDTVLVSAPVKDENALNLVVGVNDHLYDPGRHRLLTAASCTTNCLAPVVKVLHEKIGIIHGIITTIHDVTNTQVLVDAPHKDLRRARSALNSLVPTSTGSASAIGLIYPDLAGKLNGHAVRVPLLNASLTDCVFEMAHAVTADDVNTMFRAAARSDLQGILDVEDRPLVSADFLNNPHSAVIDAPSTMVVDGTQVKVFAWYDNEWGYANRLIEIAAMVADAQAQSRQTSRAAAE